jgi:hypothetical protein
MLGSMIKRLLTRPRPSPTTRNFEAKLCDAVRVQLSRPESAGGWDDRVMRQAAVFQKGEVRDFLVPR